MPAELATLRDQVARIQWYHQIDLGNGIVTPGVDNSPKKLRRLHLPERLDGLSVLDIGAWDGFFSFEAERRGAKRVLATDSFCWSGEGWGTKHGFELARGALQSKVEDLEIDVYELSPEKIGAFDVVFFLGVLYHLRHPLLALEKVAAVTKGFAIIETVSDLLCFRRPAIAFYPNAELDGDSTNWCAPNPSALVALLKTAGFERVELVSPPRGLFFRFARSVYYTFKFGAPFWSRFRTDRIVAHAWKKFPNAPSDLGRLS